MELKRIYSEKLVADKQNAQHRPALKETNQPGVWLISANGKMYDHATSFATNGFIDWRQRANYNVGDIVFIYCTRPIMRIMYKCEVVSHSMPFSQCVDDSMFWFDKNEYEKAKGGQYARLKLLEQVDTPKLSLEVLHSHGLAGNPQGPRGVSQSLYSYIDSHFNDFYTDGLFADINESEKYHEGHVRTVMVDIYERSSIARRKCIEFHGSACKICGLDFGQKYGKLGEGFIHVHHLKPLHTIGKEYVVNYKTDLIPVCPNCHAMIHRIPGGDTMNPDELRLILCEPSAPFLQAIPSVSDESSSTIADNPSTVIQITKAQPAGASTPKEDYTGRSVIHASPKFGAGIVIAEDSTTVKIKFDNGIVTFFTKESFLKGMIKFIDNQS